MGSQKATYDGVSLNQPRLRRYVQSFSQGSGLDPSSEFRRKRRLWGWGSGWMTNLKAKSRKLARKETQGRGGIRVGSTPLNMTILSPLVI